MSIPSFFQWLEEHSDVRGRRWLILGKGPSFAKARDYDLSGYEKLSLNHVIREFPVTVAHFIDWDVFLDCAEAIDRNAKILVAPWFPHFRNRPGAINLDQLCVEHAALRRLREQKRLAWYNLSSAPEFVPASPIITAENFSAEAALNLLALGGVTTVRSLGIDGGNTYSAQFADLRDRTLLNNSQTSFDRQFDQIAKTILRTGIDYAPLDVESPVRVYVATTEAQMLSFKVLEYSIRKHASMSVTVTPMHLCGVDVPLPRHKRNLPRTPFSFQRFLIPQLAGYRGRAIYLDSDMQVFKDIRRLWTTPFDGADVLSVQPDRATERRPQFSVMLLDCSRLHWKIAEIIERLDSGQLSYEELMFDLAIAQRVRFDIDPSWNSLERFEPGRTALLHYTDMNTQPWVTINNPLGHLWVSDLIEAIECGFLGVDYVEEHVRDGYVRPSLLHQVKHRIVDGLTLSSRILAMDDDFRAPYQEIVRRRASPWRQPVWYAKALLRNFLVGAEHSRAKRMIRRLLLRLGG